MATLFAPRRAGVADKARATPASDPPPPAPGPHAVAFQRGREVAALLLTVTAVFTAFALMSFHGSPGEADTDGNNWVGPVGNWWAHWLVSGIGVGAIAMPVELCLMAWPLLRNQASIATVARLAGDFLVILIFASLTQVALPGAVAFGAMPAAGGVGELFGETMRSLFSTVGSFLVGMTAIGLILIMRASFSFIGSAQKALRGTEVAATKAAFGARAVAEAWERAAELRKKQDDELRRSKQPIIHETNEAGDALVAALAEDADTPDAPPTVLHVDKHGTPRPPGLDDDPKEAPKKKRSRRKDSTPPSPVAEEPSVVGLEGTLDNDETDDPEPEPEVEEEPAPPKRSTAKIDEPQIVDHVEELVVEPAPKRRIVGKPAAGFVMPESTMLDPPPASVPREDKDALLARARELEKVLANYGVRGTVADIHTGPTVSTFEVVPAEGTKVSKVAGLADDLALGLSCKVRIVAPIPGKSRIGFELPNRERIPVNLRELVEDRRFQEMNAPLPVVLGRDIVGAPFYADLSSMPHVIVAGATGAGKSVGLNVMLVSLLMRRSPEDLRLLMIDPKVVELAPFDKIPHLLLPVVTDMKQAANALKWAVDEMERRYQLFANAGTKNISTYNGWVERAHRGEIKGFAPPPTPSATTDDGTVIELGAERELPKLPEKLPFIVIVVDEFADLMMQQGKDVEVAVARLAQKARAAGMHVILATQRPSVDVITGMIKANFPTRIGFRVAQRIDSRTILDEQGAEHLLGRGDMLVKMNGTNDTRRVQCPFVSEEEVQAVTDHLRRQGEPVYDENILKPRDEDGAPVEEDDAELDSRYDDAVRVVAETRRCSTSWLQRKLGLGYNRAAKIVETMEKRGVVGPANGTKDREVLIGPL
jgi:S-DNA-T family DNA segregation ATPase FtsK/SpoIIIE